MATEEERIPQLLDRIDELEDEIAWLIRGMNEERLYIAKIMPEADITSLTGLAFSSRGREFGRLAIRHNIYLKRSLPPDF